MIKRLIKEKISKIKIDIKYEWSLEFINEIIFQNLDLNKEYLIWNFPLWWIKILMNKLDDKSLLFLKISWQKNKKINLFDEIFFL
jgi:hypothetical protein